MDEFISIIQFRTVVPFGYFLFFAAWLGLSVWAVIKIVIMMWRREFRSIKLYTMLVVLGLTFGYAYSSVVYSRKINFVPSFSEADLIGEWVDGDSKLVLFSGGGVEFLLSDDHLTRLGMDNGKGYWHKEHGYFVILGSSTESGGINDGVNDYVSNIPDNGELRLIKYGEHFRIIIEDYGDPDMWDGHLGFKQVNK